MNQNETPTLKNDDAAKKKLLEIDRLVLICSSTKEFPATAALDLLNEILMLGSSAGDLPGEVKGGALFDAATPSVTKKLGAASLLRMAGANSVFWTDSDFRIKTLHLCDEAFISDLYPVLKLEVKSQNFEKQRSLEGLTVQILNELTELIESWSALGAAGKFRQHLMSKLSSQAMKCLVGPFLPRHLLGQRLLRLV